MRVYEKPAIIYREKIEARAANCNTGSPNKTGTAGGCGAPYVS